MHDPAPERELSASPAAAVSPSIPDLPFLDAAQGGLAAYREQNLDAALDRFRTAVAEHPSDAFSINNLGQVLARLNRPDEALDYFGRAIALNPHEWSFRFNRARAFGQMGDWPRAVDDYRTAAELFPDDYVTLYNLGAALHHAGDEVGAVQSYERAINQAPAEASFHLALAVSYERLNRVSDAVKEYRDYLDLEPHAPAADRVRAKIKQLATMPAEASPSPDGRLSSR